VLMSSLTPVKVTILLKVDVKRCGKTPILM